MKFCKECGTSLTDDQHICPNCSTKVNLVTEGNPSERIKNKILKLPMVWIGLMIIIAVITVVIFLKPQKCGLCSNKAVQGSDYCYTHKCSFCDSSCYGYSNYCYSHYLLYDDDAKGNTYSSYVVKSDLKINVNSVSSGSLYTYAKGTITNNSDSTVEYVKIKGAFKTRSGNVVDTDWTYAVGSEGLAPGETAKWELSVDKDYTIADCEITILDFDY